MPKNNNFTLRGKTMQSTKIKLAFTLAEVLITLGIIGIVAAMTIPTLLAKYQEKQTVTKLKQTYSILAQAIRSRQEDVGTPDDWEFSSSEYTYKKEDSILIAQNLLPAMKIAQDCGITGGTCTWTKNYKYLNGSSANAYGGNNLYRVVLLNGTSLSFGKWSNNEIIDFYIDINGPKQPNTIGRDLFCFSWFRDKGLYALGAPQTGYTCNKNSDGWGCTYHVLHYENMSYLK